MDPLQQMLLSLGQQRLQGQGVGGGITPQQTLYPSVGQSLAPTVVPTTSTTNDVGQIIDENGNPLPSYARGERPFGSSNVGASGTTTPGADTGTTEAGGAAARPPGLKLLDTLRGVVAPRPPDVVKPATPHLAPLRPIQGGELVQLMASLGIAPKDLPGLRQSIGRS